MEISDFSTGFIFSEFQHYMDTLETPYAKVLGLSGAIGSGKDTCVLYLQENYPNIVHIKLAHPIQDLVAILLEVYREDLSHRKLFDNRQWKESPQIVLNGKEYTPRDLLKSIGSHFRQLDPDWWLNIFKQKVLALPSSKLVVVSDVRYPNEVDFINKYLKGLLLYIYNEKAEREFFSNIDPYQIHSSESHLEYSMANSFKVLNNIPGDFSYLYSQLDELYREQYLATFLSK